MYDFTRLNILLVEDNSFVRNTLVELLRSYDIERITAVANGQEAIEYLKSMNIARQFGPDIIISDLVMSPINGLLLLRWTRTAKDSPNRMVPFMMLSGAADRDYVHSCRDLGASEFLSKPFSATSVYERLLEIIDYPRQFVTTQKYFGPDRRRKKEAVLTSQGEHREKDEDNVIVVYSADKVVKPKTPSDVWYWRLSNTLQEKVSGGAGPGAKGEVPANLIEQAEKQLERAALDFTTWAKDYLTKLSKICTDALEIDAEGGRSAMFAEIHTLALELRGQGGTFGYPLISKFGKMLFDCTGDGCVEDNSAVEIVQCHIDAMRAVIRDKVSGDGGDAGRMLLRHLKESVEKRKIVA